MIPDGDPVDLSLPVSDGAPSFPGDPPCSIRPWRTIPPDDLNLSTLEMGSHQGTHLDAPRHFIAGAATVDEVPLRQVCGPALLVDLAHKGARDRIEVADFRDVDVGPGTRLVYRTGWDRRWPGDGYFLDGPRLTVEAAEWLVGRGVILVGMDTPTPNPEAAVEIHRALLGRGAVLLEGLAGLDRLPAGRFWLQAAPIRIAGCDGAPVRAWGVPLPG